MLLENSPLNQILLNIWLNTIKKGMPIQGNTGQIKDWLINHLNLELPGRCIRSHICSWLQILHTLLCACHRCIVVWTLSLDSTHFYSTRVHGYPKVLTCAVSQSDVLGLQRLISSNSIHDQRGIVTFDWYTIQIYISFYLCNIYIKMIVTSKKQVTTVPLYCSSFLLC